MGRARVSWQAGRTGRALGTTVLAAGTGLLVGTGCGRIDGLEMVTPQGGAIRNLFVLEIVLATLVVGAVATVLAVALVRFRDRPDAPEPPQIHGNTKLELAWTAAPALLLVVLFVLTVRTMATVEAVAPERAAGAGDRLTSGGGSSSTRTSAIVTANELHVPVGAAGLAGPDVGGRGPQLLGPAVRLEEGQHAEPRHADPRPGRPAGRLRRRLHRVLRRPARLDAGPGRGRRRRRSSRPGSPGTSSRPRRTASRGQQVFQQQHLRQLPRDPGRSAGRGSGRTCRTSAAGRRSARA